MSENTKNNEVPTEFYMAVDDMLNYVQGMSETIPRQQLSAVILYAAARYNAYNWIFREGNGTQSKEEAADWFANQYRTMFIENADTLAETFKDQGVIDD